MRDQLFPGIHHCALSLCTMTYLLARRLRREMTPGRLGVNHVRQPVEKYYNLINRPLLEKLSLRQIVFLGTGVLWLARKVLPKAEDDLQPLNEAVLI